MDGWVAGCSEGWRLCWHAQLYVRHACSWRGWRGGGTGGGGRLDLGRVLLGGEGANSWTPHRGPYRRRTVSPAWLFGPWTGHSSALQGVDRRRETERENITPGTDTGKRQRLNGERVALPVIISSMVPSFPSYTGLCSLACRLLSSVIRSCCWCCLLLFWTWDWSRQTSYTETVQRTHTESH